MDKGGCLCVCGGHGLLVCASGIGSRVVGVLKGVRWAARARRALTDGVGHACRCCWREANLGRCVCRQGPCYTFCARAQGIIWSGSPTLGQGVACLQQWADACADQASFCVSVRVSSVCVAQLSTCVCPCHGQCRLVVVPDSSTSMWARAARARCVATPLPLPCHANAPGTAEAVRQKQRATQDRVHLEH